MPGAEVKVAWVWSHSKRLLTQLIEIEEHWFYLSFFGKDATTGLHRNDSTSSGASASVLADRLFWEWTSSCRGLFVPAPGHANARQNNEWAQTRGCGAPASTCLAQGVLPLPSIPHLAYLDNLAQHADGLDQFGLAGVAVDRSSPASIAARLVGGTPLSQLRSTSTATERCSKLTDSTSFIPDFILTMIPVIPRRGPSSIRATWPTCRYGQGIVERPFFTTR